MLSKYLQFGHFQDLLFRELLLRLHLLFHLIQDDFHILLDILFEIQIEQGILHLLLCHMELLLLKLLNGFLDSKLDNYLRHHIFPEFL